MRLPVMPPVKPMLARSVPEIPPGMHYEGKWDGFRSVVFRDGQEVELGSRNERPLTRYFPEVAEALREQLPDRCVLDGEIVIIRNGRLDFEALLNRIHPAESRINLLASETPAAFVAFDMLALDEESFMTWPFRKRREALVGALTSAEPPVYVTPATTDIEVAERWFDQFEGAGLDGVVAKPFEIAYMQYQRVMFKVKHERTADCVVAGYRWHKSGGVVGSLLLGLYDAEGALQHVGVAASFPMKRRAELVDELAPYQAADLSAHPWREWATAEAHEWSRLPGASSRWNASKNLSWVAVRPELVCEVAFDHMEGTRFRHVAQFRRWRPDREPRSCSYDQLVQPVNFDLAAVLSAPNPKPC